MSFCYPSSPRKLAMTMAFFASGAALFAVGIHLSYLNVAPQQARTKARNDFVKERLRQKQGKWLSRFRLCQHNNRAISFWVAFVVFLLSPSPTLEQKIVLLEQTVQNLYQKIFHKIFSHKVQQKQGIIKNLQREHKEQEKDNHGEIRSSWV